MYKVSVETDKGELITSSVVLTPDQADYVRKYIVEDTQVRTVYLIPVDELWTDEDIDQAIDDLIINNSK